MKHKKWFNWALFFCFIMFITGMVYSTIGLVNLFGEKEGVLEFQKFVTNELNTKFITVLSILNIVGISIISSVLISLSKNSDKLDKLDEEIIKYQEARIRLNKKINTL
jgi:hypothetical protein